MLSGRSIIFRRLGDDPPSSFAAQGAFACGLPSDFLEPESSERPDADLVFIFGGPRRYSGANAEILGHYTAIGTPVLMIEFASRDDRVLVHLNGNKLYLPEVSPSYGDRAEILGNVVEYQPRGSEILVVGQGPDFDRQLEHSIWGLSQQGIRRIIFRRHPNDHGTYIPPGCDSESNRPLDVDLENAFAVVTHSSGVAREALRIGRPVFCHDIAQFSSIAHRLHETWKLEDSDVPRAEDVQRYLSRFSFIEWTHEELRIGLPVSFYRRLW